MRRYLTACLLGMSILASGPDLAQAGAAKAIDFQFTDIDGRSIRLSDFRGKWVLVNFWAPWCP